MTEQANGVLSPGPALRLRGHSLRLALAAGLIVAGAGGVLTVVLAPASPDAWAATALSGIASATTVYVVRTFGPARTAAAAMRSAVRDSGCRPAVLRRAVHSDRPLALGRTAAIQADVWAQACWTETTLSLPTSAAVGAMMLVWLPMILPDAGLWTGLLAAMLAANAVIPLVTSGRDRRAVTAYLRARGADLGEPGR